jgi:hypothetical protein
MMKFGLMLPEEEVPTAKENLATTEWLAEYWNLGPEVGSEKPGDNKPYWEKLSKVWDVTELEARRRLCANCEYFVDTPKMLKALESVKFNKFDETGGGRGLCKKFDFICHNLRVCMAWENCDPMAESEDSMEE